MPNGRQIDVNSENRWRLDAPQIEGWARGVRPGAKKYFIVSCDTHLSPPAKLFAERIAPEYRERLPRIEVRDGAKYVIQEGLRPARINDTPMSGDDLLRTQAGGAATMVFVDEKVGLARVSDQDQDGVDAEVIFPNGVALFMWSSGDAGFVNAQARIWNDWVWEVCGPYKHRMAPTASLSTADIPAAIAEIERVAKMGFKVVLLPNKPVYGPTQVGEPNYNLPAYDPMWAAIQDHDLAVAFHVATGADPRTARGDGGAIINLVVHATGPIMEPIVNLCASGVFERFPKLRVATIEADAGWAPWLLQKMDEVYLKHHFWVRPKLQALPSEYFRSNCFASFGEDKAAIDLVEAYGLENNLMWANDYPHHEGSWPHSAEAIERTLRNSLREETRAKLLGLNAARCFGFEPPSGYPG